MTEANKVEMSEHRGRDEAQFELIMKVKRPVSILCYEKGECNSNDLEAEGTKQATCRFVVSSRLCLSSSLAISSMMVKDDEESFFFH